MPFLILTIVLLLCIIAVLIPMALKTKQLIQKLQKAKKLFEAQHQELSVSKSQLKKGEAGYEDLLKNWKEQESSLQSKTLDLKQLTEKHTKTARDLGVLKTQSVLQIEKLQKTEQSLQSALEQKQAELSNLELELNKASKKEQKQVINPEEFLKLKRRCRDYARLLKGAKGLRELSDARADNMQTAALHLAKHLHGKTKKLESVSEGQIIAAALEKVGGTFFNGPSENNEDPR